MAKTPKNMKKFSNPFPANYLPIILPVMLGAVLIGVVLGIIFANANFEAKVEKYISENAGIVIDALNDHARKQALAEKQQSLNLVRAHDDKTVLGNPDGDVTIYEFSDYNCGYCKRAFNDIINALEEDGNIRLVIKEFPILAESSKTAAQLSMAAAELGYFEEFHTALMQWKGRLNEQAFVQIVSDLGLDMNQLATIIAEGEIDQTIAQTQALAYQLEINGTPGFVIGDTIVPGYITKGQLLELVQQARES